MVTKECGDCESAKGCGGEERWGEGRGGRGVGEHQRQSDCPGCKVTLLVSLSDGVEEDG